MEHIAGWTNAKKKSESMQTSLLMGDAMSNSGFVSQAKSFKLCGDRWYTSDPYKKDTPKR